MKKVVLWLSDSMVNLLHASAQLTAGGEEETDRPLDCGRVLTRVVSMKAKGVCDAVIYLATPIEWRDEIDTEPPA